MASTSTEVTSSLLRGALEDAPFEFWVRDAEGRCILENAAARRWGIPLGTTTEEAPVPPNILARWKETNRRAYAGEVVRTEVEYVVDGCQRHYQSVIIPLRTGDCVVGTAGFNFDVTDLRRSERRLGEALRIGRMGYLDWNLVTNELVWSPETYRLFGYEPGGAFKPTAEATAAMVPAEDSAYVNERLEAALAGTAPYDIEHRMVRPDGEIIHVHALAEVTRDERGRPLRILGTVIDVTERKRAEDALRISEERRQLALEAASASTWDWDIRTGKIDAERRRYGALGLDPDGPQLTFEAWKERLHPDDREAIEETIRAALEGQTSDYRAEVRTRTPDGVERWSLAAGRIERAPDGTALRMSGLSIDITDRKRIEEELREQDRRKETFLRVLSHELRNPLAPIRTGLDIIKRAPAGSEQTRRALASMDRQVTHLTRLVDDLLDLTRISSGRVRLQSTRVDLALLVRHICEDHRALLASRDMSVQLPDEQPVWIQGDETRLAQVIGNLLQNAVKFTTEAAKVSVSLACDRERAVLEVADTGMGIDAETLSRLFTPFVQADRSLDRSRGGLGLGLALVKTLVEMHGGDIGARSDGPGRGTCFTVRLPLDVRAPSPRPPA
jgi:PAS domain S-box-containing protein